MQPFSLTENEDDPNDDLTDKTATQAYIIIPESATIHRREVASITFNDFFLTQLPASSIPPQDFTSFAITYEPIIIRTTQIGSFTSNSRYSFN